MGSETECTHTLSPLHQAGKMSTTPQAAGFLGSLNHMPYTCALIAAQLQKKKKKHLLASSPGGATSKCPRLTKRTVWKVKSSQSKIASATCCSRLSLMSTSLLCFFNLGSSGPQQLSFPWAQCVIRALTRRWVRSMRVPCSLQECLRISRST